jgi:hypothetical protein
MTDTKTTDEELSNLLSCLSNERFEKSLSSIICCIFHVTNADSEGLELLLESTENRKDLDLDPVEIQRLWKEACDLGRDDVAKFDIENLHAWATNDNPGRYDWYAQQDELAKIGSSLLFG